nr:hypothetical protein Iba_scaffold377662CG0010 [Ipomoea batatas]GME03091.1 hypothetical protein Iba_scaffold446CG0390 [Ipomoea batatas]GME20618.1 hypothetical protein Iba_scaffold25631CG0010 [Ipomoea batatas]
MSSPFEGGTMSGTDNQSVSVQDYDEEVEVNSFSLSSYNLTIWEVKEFAETRVASPIRATIEIVERPMVHLDSNPEGVGPSTWVKSFLAQTDSSPFTSRVAPTFDTA